MAPPAQRGAAPALIFDGPFGHRPVFMHNELVLSGSVDGSATVDDVRVEVEGRLYHAAHGLPRARGHRGFDLRVDTAGWSVGTRVVRVTVRNSAGAEATAEGEVDVRPYEVPSFGDADTREVTVAGKLTMWCEAPALDGSERIAPPVWVEGWAWSAAGVEEVAVYVDGTLRVPARHGLPRPHLVDTLGDEVAGGGGFVATLDPSECPPGWHTVTVIATDADGRAVGVSGPVECRPGEEAPPVESEDTVTPTLLADRYVPEAHVGYSFEPEHHARYRWAAGIASGRRVLDAGSGTGFGTQILATAGASRAEAFDVSLEAVEYARSHAGDVAHFAVGDLKQIPYPDASFDLVTCFEAIEHVDDPGRVLEELHRVLAPGGVLLVSTPNRGVYPEGNVHHLRELSSKEFEAEVSKRFTHFRIFRQTIQATSLLCGDDTLALADTAIPLELDLRKVTGNAPGEELYTVALAGDGPLPDMPELAVIGSAIDLAARQREVQAWKERALQAETAAATERAQARETGARRERALAELATVRELQEATEAARTVTDADLAAAQQREAAAGRAQAAAERNRAAAEAELERLRDSASQGLIAKVRRLRTRLRRRPR